MKIRIGTRGSKLAIWQARHVSDLLQHGELEPQIVTIDTKGDKILEVSIAKIGSKGVFTEEIENQLADGLIDIAVHSAKDMQSVLPERFEILAFLERERPHDVVISHKQNIDINKPILLGTSSTRRIALLKKYHPNIKTIPVRGNLQTRINKMQNGACDGLLLAFAGVHRMNYDHMIVYSFDNETFTPAVGQGSIAIECAKNMNKITKNKIKMLLNHPPTETKLLAERAYLRKLEGGCSIPIFALATRQNTQLVLTGGIVSLDGEQLVRQQVTVDENHPELAGELLADKVLNIGGNNILKEIRKSLN